MSHQFDDASQTCHPWKTVRLSSVYVVHTPLTAGGCWRRYSNTLLVSLNNRISIREVPTHGAEVESSAVMVPVTSLPGVTSSVAHVESEKPSATLGAWPSGDRRDSGSIRVFGEKYHCQPFGMLFDTPWFCRHCVIRVVHGQDIICCNATTNDLDVDS